VILDCVKMAALTTAMVLLIIVSCIILNVMFTASATIDCPQMCHCQHYRGGNINRTLIVDCGGGDVNESILAQELDLLFSDDELRENLTHLNITNTPLTQVPMSVCQLSNLRVLRLSNNQLTELPDNCFTNMTALMVLVADHNNITKLQDGLLDGLNSLEMVAFPFNSIASIGLHVFSNPNDLVNLTHISLQFNRLRSLEPWPYIRGLHGSEDSKIRVYLGYNRISEFTNNIGCQINCSSPSYSVVDMSSNCIKHLNDILTGWNVALDQWFCLLYISTMYSVSQDHGAPMLEQKARGFLIDYSYSYNYSCDCFDVDLLSITSLVPDVNFFNKMWCSQPLSLADRMVSSVPLNEFVCELSYRCPPTCRCVYRRANFTLHVYCSDANLTSLPLDLPLVFLNKYKLDFSNNRLLRRLEHRPYLVNTSVLDVSNCATDFVELNAWRAFAMMPTKLPVVLQRTIPSISKASLFVDVPPVVFLHGNKIESLSPDVTDINLTSVHVTLSDNPWKCSCDNRWMIAWFQSLSSAASSNIGDVLCASPSRLEGRSILQSDEVDFCVDPLTRMLKIVLSTTLSVVAGFLMLGFAVHRLRFRLYKRWKFHPFDRDECVGEDMDYDVFLCCSSDDHIAHGEPIVQQMELKGYRVCYHERDFLPGQRISDNMVHSIERSKRTVCLISRNFLQR